MTEWTSISCLRRKKNRLRKKAFAADATDDDRMKWKQCLKAYNVLRNKFALIKEQRLIRFHETLYAKDFWDFAKRATNGNLDNEPVQPSFSKEDADEYYLNKYGSFIPPRENMDWCPKVEVNPGDANFFPFQMDPFKPHDIKNILKRRNLRSAPGPDGLTYQAVSKLKCLHRPLATLYNKVLQMGQPPSLWSTSMVKLIYKKGITSDPANFRMIALGPAICKIFHLLIAKRLAAFILSNNYINTSVQKGFLPLVSGCIEHNFTLETIIQEAKQSKKTVHITFFDLRDAFGSVSHNLIYRSLSRNNIPQEVCRYLKEYYKNLTSSVKTDNWSSNFFPLKQGVCQGDPLSPLIFNIVFNPLLEFIQSRAEKGFSLRGEKIICLPYADDFTLITSNKRDHQNLIKEIVNKTQSMNLMLAPNKCRSFSISTGKPDVVNFKIGLENIPSIKSEEQKFLGRLLFFNGKGKETLSHIKSELTRRLSNLNKTKIRQEFKLAIYSRYILPSMRYLLTVHDLNKSSLNELDNITAREIKQWAGLPKCATRTIIHHNKTLDIPSISSLYEICHATATAAISIKGDEKVKHCLNIRLNRELQSKREKTIQKSISKVEEVRRGLPSTTENGDTVIHKFLKDKEAKAVAKTLRRNLRLDSQEIINSKVCTYKKQGDFLKLLSDEEEDPEWKSFIYNMPRGTMKFLLNAAINTLPTSNNLLQWGKKTSDQCKHCKMTETTQHVLNGCPKFLTDGRYTWRHDNILNFLCNTLKQSRFEVYCDLPESCSPGGGTIPPDIMITSLRPDLVIINRHMKEISIYELTVPYENRIEAAHSQKQRKYLTLVSDIEASGWNVFFCALEIGSRGYISKENKLNLTSLLIFIDNPPKKKKFTSSLSKLTVLGSYKIFLSRRDESWTNPDFITAT